MGWIIAIVVVALVATFAIYTANEHKRNPHLRIRPPAPAVPAAAPSVPAARPEPRTTSAPWPPEVAGWMMEARKAFDAGDIDRARMCYQKAAYGFAQLTPEQNEGLKREIASFADHDPRYQAGLALVRQMVRANPGMLQSELGKSAGPNREALNYVLYYADQLGDIVRVKSGRSYRLYLPGQSIPPEPEKPKRVRAKRSPKAD